jgi:hypothetical protein
MDRIKSGWDYAAEGISGLSEGMQQRREREKQKKDQARAEKIQEFQLINQLYGSGAATAEQLNMAAGATGLPAMANIKALPSQAERRSKIVDAPDINMQIPDVSGSMTGMPVRMKRADVVSDAESEAAGLEKPSERQARVTDNKLNTQKKTDTHFNEAAERFVAAEVPDVMSVDPRTRDAVVAAAFAKYKAMRQRSAMGQIPDEAYAKSFFDQAFSGLVTKRRSAELELKKSMGRGLSADERLFSEITERLNNVRARLQTLRADKMLEFKLNDPKYANDAAVQEYRQLDDMEGRLIKAQSRIADPRIAGIIDQPKATAAAPAATPTTPVDTTNFQGKVKRTIKLVSSAKNIEQAKQWIAEAVGKTITQDVANEAIKQLDKRQKEAMSTRRGPS